MNSKMTKLVPCVCGSNNIKQYTPYGVESVHCKDCFVSLRLVDWNRVMGVNEIKAQAIEKCAKDYEEYYKDWNVRVRMEDYAKQIREKS